MSPIKIFFTQFSHFITGSGLSLLLGLVTFPILTRFLTQEQYGVLGLVTTTMLLLVAVSKAGLSNGIIRFYQEFDGSENNRTIFTSTVLIRGLLLSAITVALYLLFFPMVSEYLGMSKKFIFCFMIMSFYLFIRPLNIIVLNLLRVNGKTLFMNVLGVIGRIISIGLSLFLLIYITKKLYGYFIGVIIGEFIISIVLFYWFFSQYKIKHKKISKKLTFNLLKFGTPLLFTELSYLLLSYADRYMIAAYNGASALGVYSVGYNMAMYIADLITFSISYAIVPIFVEVYEKYGKEETERFLQKALHYLLIGVIPICFGFYAVSHDLIILIASDKYALASTFSPIILVGTILLGLNNIFNAGLYMKKKTTAILCIMLFSVGLNIILNIILLPKYGITGAAYATLITCIISVIITICVSYKYIFIGINLKTNLYYLLLAFFMLFVIKQISVATIWIDLAAKIITGILIFILGVLLKDKEIRAYINAFFIKNKAIV